jgi:hypothetical protein
MMEMNPQVLAQEQTNASTSNKNITNCLYATGSAIQIMAGVWVISSSAGLLTPLGSALISAGISSGTEIVAAIAKNEAVDKAKYTKQAAIGAATGAAAAGVSAIGTSIGTVKNLREAPNVIKSAAAITQSAFRGVTVKAAGSAAESIVTRDIKPLQKALAPSSIITAAVGGALTSSVSQAIYSNSHINNALNPLQALESQKEKVIFVATSTAVGATAGAAGGGLSKLTSKAIAKYTPLGTEEEKAESWTEGLTEAVVIGAATGAAFGAAEAGGVLKAKQEFRTLHKEYKASAEELDYDEAVKGLKALNKNKQHVGRKLAKYNESIKELNETIASGDDFKTSYEREVVKPALLKEQQNLQNQFNSYTRAIGEQKELISSIVRYRSGLTENFMGKLRGSLNRLSVCRETAAQAASALSTNVKAPPAVNIAEIPVGGLNVGQLHALFAQYAAQQHNAMGV